MLKALVTLLTISSSLFAFECVEPKGVTPLPLFDLHQYANDLQEEINWFSATDKDIDDAKCVDDEDFSDEAIAKYLDGFGPEITTQSIKGIRVTDHPQKIALLKKLIDPDEYGIKIDLPKEANNCSDVNCVTKALFKDNSNNYLYMLDKFGLNLNSNRKKDTSQWNKKEVQNLMNSLNYVPKQILPFSSNQTLVRGKREENTKSSTYANAVMYFYDLHFTQTPQMQTYTILHEIGHNIASNLDLDESKEWTELSSWEAEYTLDKDSKPILDYKGKPIAKSWHTDHNHKMTSEYGQTNPVEDFAETFAAYRFTPEKLKKISPKKYQYMKDNVFQGLEYTDELLCKKENSIQYINFKKENAKIPNRIDDFTVCKDEIPSIINKELTQKNIIKCTKKLMAQESIKRSLKENNKKLSNIASKSVLNSSLLPIKNISPTAKDINQTKKLLTNELMNSYIKEFYMFSSCDENKERAYLNLESIEDKIVDSLFFHKQRKIIANGLSRLCKNHKKIKKFKCSDYTFTFNEEDKKMKNILCSTGTATTPNKLIDCTKDMKFNNKLSQDAYKNICSSKNLKAPSQMSCNKDTRLIFAELIGLSESDLSKEAKNKNGECQI